jgi:monovalent cation:H+ antiporter-2, CPA2 family
VITVAVVLGAAALALGLSTWARLPAAVAGILVGVAVSVAAVPVSAALVRDALLLSATFLVFSVGAEIDRRYGAAYRGRARLLVLAHLLVTALAVLGVASLLRLDGWTVFYLVLGFSGSSTLLVLELLRRRQRFFEPTGRLVTSVALTQDLWTILALSLVAHGLDEPLSLARSVAAMVALGLLAWAVIRWVAPRVLLRGGLGEEERLLFALAVLFAFAGAAHSAGLPVVFGAYFAGMALSRFPEAGVVRSYVTSFSDFFTIVFFVTLGMVVVLPRPVELVTEAVVVATVLLVRPVLLLPLARRMGLTVRSAMEAVVTLGQSGEVALVVALVGLDRGHIGEDVVGIIAVVAVVTMSLTPWLSSHRVILRLTHWYPFRGKAPLSRMPTGHMLLIGCGDAGRVILDQLLLRGCDVVVMDDDPAVVEALQAQDVTALRGDGSDATVLKAAGADHAHAIVSTMRRMADNLGLLERFRGSRVLVRVFSEAEAERVRSAGGHPVVEAEVAKEAFMRWLAYDGADLQASRQTS